MIRVYIRRKARKNFYLYYTDPLTGREVTKSAKTPDKGEAERAAARWEAELLENRGTDGCGWAYFRVRFEDEHLSSLPKKSRYSYQNALNHFERLVKLKTVTDATTDHVSRFRGLLLAEGKPHTTVANILTHCRAAFKWAEGIGMLRKCPKFTMPRLTIKRFMRGRAVSDAEFQQLLKQCHVPLGKSHAKEFRRLLEMLRLSGLRIEEASQLSWDSPPIQVFPDAEPHPYLLFYGEGQKSNRDEIVPITPAFAKWLWKTPAKERIGLVAPVHGLKGEPFEAGRLSRMITEIGAAAKVLVNDYGKPASAHDLRRAFGHEWALKVKPLVLQRLMRHSSLVTTMKFYAQLDSEDVGMALWGQEVSRKKSRKGTSNRGRRTRESA